MLMHGFGAPGEDLAALAGVLDVPAGVRFVFPAAPTRLGAGYGHGRAWWMIDMAALACDLAFRTTRPLAGLVLLSGTLLAANEWIPGMSARRGLPVFQSHGDRDPLLPFSMARALRDHLIDAGLSVEWTAFPGGHEIPQRVLARLGAFLTRVAMR